MILLASVEQDTLSRMNNTLAACLFQFQSYFSLSISWIWMGGNMGRGVLLLL